MMPIWGKKKKKNLNVKVETFSQTNTSACGYLFNLLLNASNKSLNMANFSKSTDYFIFYSLDQAGHW